MCRPGRTLVGVVAQAVGAAVGAAHALCLGGVEVALADHPGGLVAGELQRGGGGQELHRQGGSRSLENMTIAFLHKFGERFRADTRDATGSSAHCGSTARRATAASVAGVATGARLTPVSDETGAVGPTRSTRPRLASAFDEDGMLLLSTQSTLRRSHACRGSPGRSCDAGNNPCRRQGHGVVVAC